MVSYHRFCQTICWKQIYAPINNVYEFQLLHTSLFYLSKWVYHNIHTFTQLYMDITILICIYLMQFRYLFHVYQPLVEPLLRITFVNFLPIFLLSFSCCSASIIYITLIQIIFQMSIISVSSILWLVFSLSWQCCMRNRNTEF